MRQFFALELALFFSILARSDVYARSDISRKPAVGCVSRRTVINDPAIFAIGTSQPVLHRERLLGLEIGAVGLDGVFKIFRVNAFRPALPQFLLRGVPG